MKRFGYLYEKVFSKHQDVNLHLLHIALRDRKFKTSPYTTFKIFEPKERTVFRLPYYPDRIVHHAIMNVLEPIFVSLFTADTYNVPVKTVSIIPYFLRSKSVLAEKR